MRKTAAGQQALPGVLSRPRQAPARRSYPVAPRLTEPLDPPVVTALDLSYSSTGVAWLDTLGYVGVTSIPTTAPPPDSMRYGLDLATRRALILGRLPGYIAADTLVVREQRIESLNVPGNSALDIAGLHASVEDLVYGMGRNPIASVNLGRLKKYATGTGSARKDNMVSTAQREFAGLVAVVNDDEADALWLLALSCRLLGLPMDITRRYRVEVVEQCRPGWPDYKPLMPGRILTRLRSGN